MDQKLKFPDYENGLANLAQSVLKNFGIREKGQKTLACLDPFLEKEYEIIVVFLLDGMGSRINGEQSGGDRIFPKPSERFLQLGISADHSGGDHIYQKRTEAV